jgi:hypothetical protein
MTDTPDNDIPDVNAVPHPLDDLASAHLDGQTSAEEAARVTGEPLLTARVEALRAARDALRRADDQSLGAAAELETRREAAIAAALSAYDEEPSVEVGVAAQGVRPLAPLAAARRSVDGSRRTRQLVGIAAAIILLALAVPLLGGLGSGADDDDSATAELDTRAADEDAASSDTAESDTAESSGTMEAEEPTAASEALDQGSSALPHLGAVETWAELADAVAAARGTSPLAGSATTTAPAADDSTARSSTLAAGLCPTAGDGAVFLALADYDGRAVIVRVVVDDAGVERIQGLDPADCSVVLEIGVDG